MIMALVIALLYSTPTTTSSLLPPLRALLCQNLQGKPKDEQAPAAPPTKLNAIHPQPTTRASARSHAHVPDLRAGQGIHERRKRELVEQKSRTIAHWWARASVKTKMVCGTAALVGGLSFAVFLFAWSNRREAAKRSVP